MFLGKLVYGDGIGNWAFSNNCCGVFSEGETVESGWCDSADSLNVHVAVTRYWYTRRDHLRTSYARCTKDFGSCYIEATIFSVASILVARSARIISNC